MRQPNECCTSSPELEQERAVSVPSYGTETSIIQDETSDNSIQPEYFEHVSNNTNSEDQLSLSFMLFYPSTQNNLIADTSVSSENVNSDLEVCIKYFVYDNYFILIN